MSHFSVLVIGDNVAEQLQPFHEFECTGVRDKYVVDVDITAEARKRYETATEFRLRTPSGELINPFDDEGNYKKEFAQPSQDPLLKKITSRRELFIPIGWTSEQVNSKSLGIPFLDWAADYYEYEIGARAGKRIEGEGDNLRIINYTNPNAKWDWWVVGGRWNNRLKLLNGHAPAPLEHAAKAGYDNRQKPGWCDSLFAGALDISGMAAAIVATKHYIWRQFRDSKTLRDNPITSWENVLKKNGDNLNAAREEFNSQPGLAELERIVGKNDFLFNEDHYMEFSRLDEAEFVNWCKLQAVSAFAYVRDAEWHEAASMGWFGAELNRTIAKPDWRAHVLDLLTGLPSATRVTMVDCHI